MAKTAIHTSGAPAAIGPYSQAVRTGSTIFCSGQIALAPDTAAMVEGGVEAETRQVMNNLTAVLAAGGATWNDVVKTTIYLTDLGAFETVNRVYAEYVEGTAPARATVQVAALPKGAVVEIDAVATVEEGA